MNLRAILDVKGRTVHTIDRSATLGDVVAKLVEKNCGSLVVCEDGNVVGIITERDILRVCAKQPGHLDTIPVSDVMTTGVITGRPDDELASVMGLMTEKRLRHLPVLEDGKLAGLVSIGDVVKAQHNQLTMENHYLKTYIQS